MMILFFFFFKQKTAYEMRISDWSSDVCSSDLDARLGEEELRQGAGKIRSAIADQLEQALLASRASVMLHDAEHVAHLPAAAVLQAVFLDDGAAGGAQDVGQPGKLVCHNDLPR